MCGRGAAPGRWQSILSKSTQSDKDDTSSWADSEGSGSTTSSEDGGWHTLLSQHRDSLVITF